MQALPDRALLEEAYRRLGSAVQSTATAAQQKSRILETRFQRQRDFILSPAKRKALLCPRRAGKTEADAAYMLEEAIDGPERLVIFVAKTRQRAKDLTWRAVEKLCESFGIESKPNETTFTRTFANRSVIRWTGADDLEELKKKRGDKPWLVIIDEAQDFSFAILKTLVVDIFGPSLEDLGGTLALTGTPGETCAGYWYKVTGDDADPLNRIGGFQRFGWSVLDNPHVPLIHARIRSGEIAAQCGGADSASFQREWLGRWVNDIGALFYRFSEELNLHDAPDDHVTLVGDGWQHVLGWDLGHKDDMAMVVWGFHPKLPNLFECASWKKPGALIDECAAMYRAFERRFNLIAQVADTGGGGAMFVAEMAQRHGITFEAAKKTEKAEHVKLFNSDLASGIIKLQRGSQYAEEIAVLPKDKNWADEKAPREDPRFANHCSDAGLYAWRRAYNFLHTPQVDAPPPGSPEFYAEQERALIEQREAAQHRRKSTEWWEAA